MPPPPAGGGKGEGGGGSAEGLYGALKRRNTLPYAYSYCISSIAFISSPIFPTEMDFPLPHFYTTTIWFYSFHYYHPLCNHTVIPYRNVFPNIGFPYGFRSEINFPPRNYQTETRRFKTYQISFRLVLFNQKFITCHLTL